MTLSIIIPVINEAVQIVAALQAVRSVAPAAEIIVVDGGSTDETPTLARPYAHVITAARGRARQMNAGAALATGDALVFLHADTRLHGGALEAITNALADPQVVGGAFALRFDESGPVYKCIAYNTNLRSKLRHSYTGDQAMFVRTTVFRAIGGYADIPLMEDLALSRDLRAAGRTVLLQPLVLVSARRHRAHGPLRVLAWGWVLQTLYAFGVSEQVLHRLYYGRWAS